MDINKMLAEIAKNNAGEQAAISEYFRLISDVPGLPMKFYDDIREIVSDEMNHSKKLSYWATQLSGIHPAKD